MLFCDSYITEWSLCSHEKEGKFPSLARLHRIYSACGYRHSPDAPCIQIPCDDLFRAELSGFISCTPRADTGHSVRSTLYIWPGLQLYYPLLTLHQLLLGLVQVVKQYHPPPLAWLDWWEMVAIWLKPLSCLELFSFPVCNPTQTFSFPKVHFLCEIRSPSVNFCRQ